MCSAWPGATPGLQENPIPGSTQELSPLQNIPGSDLTESGIYSSETASIKRLLLPNLIWSVLKQKQINDHRVRNAEFSSEPSAICGPPFPCKMRIMTFPIDKMRFSTAIRALCASPGTHKVLGDTDLCQPGREMRLCHRYPDGLYTGKCLV